LRRAAANKMFKLKYNVLSLIQIFFGFLNSVLLLKIFGVSIYTDAYFMGDIILGGLVMVQMMAVEQFMYVYNELKARDRESAHALYAYALWLSLVIGIGSFVVINLFSGSVITVFAYKLDPARLAVLKRLFPVFSLLAVFNPLNFLNFRLLNAEGRFAYPYALGIIPSFFSSCAMLFLYFSGTSDIMTLLAASVGGNAAAGLLGLWAVRSSGVPVRLAAGHPSARSLISSSFKVRFGYNINNILAPLITNNMLSAFSAGSVSYFGYAWKIVTVVGNLTTGPSARMFASGISLAWPEKNVRRIKAMAREYLRLIAPLFCVSVLLAYAGLPWVLRLVASARLGGAEITVIQLMFLALSGWYFTGLIESASIQICMAGQLSKVFIINNSVFVAAYLSAAWAAKGVLGIYSIPAGLITAQLISLMLYYRSACGLLGSLDSGGKGSAPGPEAGSPAARRPGWN